MRTSKKHDLKIGYKTYVLRFADKLSEKLLQGECYSPSKHDHAKGYIRIKKGQDPVEKANTILHEINHAICADKGLELSDKLEERIVSAITNGQIAFIRDNPEFFRQLLRLLEH